MEYIKITKQDIVKNMTDEQKHNLAIVCQLNGTSVDETLDLLKNALKGALKVAVDCCNVYFQTLEGKDYLEKRKEIEKIGMGMK
jgi:succinyl-CoA synthetase beta subunit